MLKHTLLTKTATFTGVDMAMNEVRRHRDQIRKSLSNGQSVTDLAMSYGREFGLSAPELGQLEGVIQTFAPKTPFYANHRKRAHGYYNFEWQGNDAVLFGPDKQHVLLSGKAARKFQDELERIEDEIPHDEALELAVNDMIKAYFTGSTEPPQE